MFRALSDALLRVTEIELAVAATFIIAERLVPSIRAQKLLRQGLLFDIGCVYFAALLGVAAAWLFPRVIAGLGWEWMTRPLVATHGFLATMPFAVQLLAAIFLSDLFGYWKHRLMHTRLFWRFHALHHSSRDVDWLSNDRAHPIEMILSSTMPLVPLVVLDFPLATIAWAAQFRHFHSIYEHANLRIDYGRGDYLFVSPRFHRSHHARDPAFGDKNFANVFALFDWLFGTWRSPTHEPPAGGFGLMERSTVTAEIKAD